VSFSPAGGASSAPVNHVAGFEGPLRGGGKRGRGRKGTERTGENAFRKLISGDGLDAYRCSSV